MVRVLFVIAWFAASVYAISDWATTPADRMPLNLPRMTWLIILVVTVPFLSLGALAWIILKAVANAEQRQEQASPKAPAAPDDDPEFLFRLERDLQMKRKREEEKKNTENPSTAADGEGSDPRQDEDPTPSA